MPDDNGKGDLGPAAMLGAGVAASQNRVRMTFACDCGSENLARFGPYTDDGPTGDGETSNPGLRWVFTCTRCGEQLRIYATRNRKTPAAREVEFYRGLMVRMNFARAGDVLDGEDPAETMARYRRLLEEAAARAADAVDGEGL